MPVLRIVDKVLGAIRFLRAYRQHLPLVFEFIFFLPCIVRVLRGSLRDSGEEIVLLYVGRRRNYVYLLRTIFAAYDELETKHTSVLTFRKHMNARASSADVVLLDLGWPYNGLHNRRREFLDVPDWVSMSIEFPKTWEEVVRNFRQTTRNNDLRLIRRNGYTYRVIRDRQAAEYFHDHMYLPSVSHRHAADSTLAPRRHVLRRARKGQLLQVMRDNELVVAGVIYAQQDVLYFLWMGLAPQFIESPPEGAISALYFFGIQYAFENNYSVVDFTGSRSLLDDGALKFKRKWGACVEDSFSPSSILIRPSRGNAKAVAFCERFPVLIRAGGRLEALFVSTAQSLNDQAIMKLKKEYGCKGIERLTVISISAENETRSLPMGPDGCQCRVVSTTLDGFAECYVTQAPEAPYLVGGATAGGSELGSTFAH